MLARLLRSISTSSYTSSPGCKSEFFSAQMVASTTSLYFILLSQICPGRKYLILPIVLRLHHGIITVLLHVKEICMFLGGRMVQVRRLLALGFFFVIYARKVSDVNCLASLTHQSGPLDDFFTFNPANMKWTDLTRLVSGDSPGPRFAFGFASSGGKIFVFGGERSTGNIIWFFLLSLV